MSFEVFRGVNLDQVLIEKKTTKTKKSTANSKKRLKLEIVEAIPEIQPETLNNNNNQTLNSNIVIQQSPNSNNVTQIRDEVKLLEFRWNGKIIKVEPKKRKFYSSFTWRETTYRVKDNVLLRSPNGEIWIASIEEMWYSIPKKENLFLGRWFWSFSDIESYLKSINSKEEIDYIPHPRELFISEYLDVNSIRHILGKCIVKRKSEVSDLEVYLQLENSYFYEYSFQNGKIVPSDRDDDYE